MKFKVILSLLSVGILPVVFIHCGTIRCLDTQKVYDITFDFQRKCSMTVYWTTPNCPSEVTRYIVQSTQECRSAWNTQGTVMGNTHSFMIDDLALLTSCLLGKCNIRVSAEFNYFQTNQSERIESHCVGFGNTFYDPLDGQVYNSHIGQQVCLPVTTRCAPNTIPHFIINGQTIAPSTDESEGAEYYLSNDHPVEICIRNNSDSNSIILETCHIDTLCPLCDVDNGELVFMSRTEISTLEEQSSAMPREERDYVPSVIIFCNESDTYSFTNDINEKSLNVCICLPLHEIHGHDSEDIVVEVSLQGNYTHISPAKDVHIKPNIASQCFEIDNSELLSRETASLTALEICLMLHRPVNDTRCVHIPLPCLKITISHGEETSTTTGNHNNMFTKPHATANNKAIITSSILSPIAIIIIIIFIILMVAFVYRRDKIRKWAQYKETEQNTSGHEMNQEADSCRIISPTDLETAERM